jgi:DNA-binding response OmpR family regulator
MMKKIKVLLVDDEEEFVSTLAERLHLRGIEATVATDGEKALEKIREDPPQVVILDVMMPGIGGQEVLKRIKIEFPSVQVILLTGRGSQNEAIEGMKLGAFDYLIKPLKIEELIQKMDAAVKEGTKKGR